MSEDKHHGAIKEAITDFEREARALDEHMGLDAQNSKVQEFVHGLNEFSPWIREELLKVSKLEAKKRALEKEMDRQAAENIKIRLAGRFTQKDMANRAMEIRQTNSKIHGINSKIFEITSKIQSKTVDLSDVMDESIKASKSNRSKPKVLKKGARGRRSATPKTPRRSSMRRSVSRNEEDERERPITIKKHELDPDVPIDPDEPIYCICRKVSYGEMVACDNLRCHYEWFHFKCVGLSEKPEGTWYCPLCRDSMTVQKDFLAPYTDRPDYSAADSVLNELSKKEKKSGKRSRSPPKGVARKR